MGHVRKTQIGNLLSKKPSGALCMSAAQPREKNKETAMKRNENTDTGEVSFHFTGDEWKKLKIGGIAAGIILIASLGTAVYSAVSMESLSRQNQLYQNQLKMAEEKMKSLEDKTETIEKLSDQLQEMVKANNNGAAQNMTGGIGGASTIPDKAKTVSAKEQMTGTSYATPGSLLKSMRQLDARLDAQIKTMIVLREQVMNQTYGMQITLLSASSTTPDIWPVKGQVSSSYGFRVSPGGIGSTYHEGLDIAADYGAPVSATASGTVTRAGWVDGYGYLVEVKHDGDITTRYGHNSAILVTEGQQVEQGTILALVGSTGNSTGPHCHYEVRIHGDAVDPTYFLPGND